MMNQRILQPKVIYQILWISTRRSCVKRDCRYREIGTCTVKALGRPVIQHCKFGQERGDTSRTTLAVEHFGCYQRNRSVSVEFYCTGISSNQRTTSNCINASTDIQKNRQRGRVNTDLCNSIQPYDILSKNQPIEIDSNEIGRCNGKAKQQKQQTHQIDTNHQTTNINPSNSPISPSSISYVSCLQTIIPQYVRKQTTFSIKRCLHLQKSIKHFVDEYPYKNSIHRCYHLGLRSLQQVVVHNSSVSCATINSYLFSDNRDRKYWNTISDTISTTELSITQGPLLSISRSIYSDCGNTTGVHDHRFTTSNSNYSFLSINRKTQGHYSSISRNIHTAFARAEPVAINSSRIIINRHKTVPKSLLKTNQGHLLSTNQCAPIGFDNITKIVEIRLYTNSTRSHYPLLSTTQSPLASIIRRAHSGLPDISEADLEESFIKGSGPGGQCVNKRSNCVMLKHLPTGLVIKCQESRSLDRNRKLARLRMKEKLDWHYNKENSIAEQEKRFESVKRKTKKSKTNKRLAKLKEFKEREGLAKDSLEGDSVNKPEN